MYSVHTFMLMIRQTINSKKVKIQSKIIYQLNEITDSECKLAPAKML